MKAPDFESRWLITGTLVTLSELHLGDGGAARILDRAQHADKENEQASIASDANTVCTSHSGPAYVPGSGIKGALRELVMISKDPTNPGKQAPIIHPDWEELLGSDKPDALASVGGKLEFRDAFHAGGKGNASHQPDPDRLHESLDNSRPWWNDTRKTAVAVSVSLDRRTRTAKENLLYHLEYVPAGERFDFEIGGDNLKSEEIARLLALLDRLGDGTATLGAQASNGWGRVRIEDLRIHRLDVEGMRKWKASRPSAPPSLPEIDDAIRAEIDDFRKEINLPSETRHLRIALALVMESPWLVRDPRQRERSDAAKKNDVPEAHKPKDAEPIRDESGAPFIPANSLRGALRSRAEMILRTVFDPASLDFPRPHPGDYPAVSTKHKKIDEVIKDIKKLDLAARLFGLGGWRAPLDVPRLTQPNRPNDFSQEFVAIDRFTGGAAEHLKFNANLAGMTTLGGTLIIDLNRLERVDPDLASLGLLALVLRDLAEGDIPLGSGSAKGQGLCSAEVTWDGKNLLSDPDCTAGEFLKKFQSKIPKANDQESDNAAA